MQNKIIYGLVGFTVLVILLGYKIKQTEMIDRAPAKAISLPEQHGQILEAKGTEVYSFDRKVKANFDTKILADTEYTGFFIVNWISNIGNERIGRFSFVLKDSAPTSVFVEAKLTQDYLVISVKESKIDNADEEDVLAFTKDLLSIYAFQSLHDTTGRYQARIYETSKGNWLKKKIRYEDQQYADLRFEKSIHQIRLSAAGIEELSGVEETSLQAQQKKGFKTKSTYEMKRVDKAQVSQEKITANLSGQTQLGQTTLTVTPVFATSEKISWEEVFSKIDQVANLSGNERLGFFHEMVKALKANPEKLAELAKWARTNLQNPKIASFAVGVLATNGSPEAQKELVNIYQDSVTHPDQKPLCHLILNAFATTQAPPTSETKDFLTSQMRSTVQPDLAMNAAFAAGASLQRDASPEIERQLAETAAQAKSINEKLAYLDAMGNSGSAQFIPQISESFQSQDAALREKSVFALRYMSDDRATALLQSAIKDPSLTVQISAARAIAYQRDIAPYRAVLSQCASSTESRLRQACTQTLSN